MLFEQSLCTHCQPGFRVNVLLLRRMTGLTKQKPSLRLSVVDAAADVEGNSLVPLPPACLRSGTRKIVRRQFETRCRMGEQLALSNPPDAAIPVPEGLHGPGLTGSWFKPEMGLQCRDRDHAFDR